MKRFSGFPIALFLLFEAVAVTLWLTLDDPFYLFNFTYIGLTLSVGLALWSRKVPWARRAVQLAVGLYMLVYLGLLSGENMQLEGFWYYLFLGVFQAAVIHYAVAKLFGPLIFGRGWCGYACWTAMVLDFLPWKRPEKPRKKLSWPRYALFVTSLCYVSALFILGVPDLERVMARSFVVGNLIYYALGITLAAVFRDNRAFCKYVCPVTVFLKPMSKFALFRIRCDESKCLRCGACRKVCPMEVDMLEPGYRRENGTECILCLECVRVCPGKALDLKLPKK